MVKNSDAYKSTLVKNVVFILLCSATIYLVGGIIQEYLKATTYFSLSKEPVTNEDLPSVTICFTSYDEMALGKDLAIHTAVQHKSNWSLVGLKEGQHVFDFFGKRRVTLKSMVVWQNTPLYRRTCIVMHLGLEEELKMKQGNWHDIGLFTSTLSSNVSKQHNVKAYLSLTTEQNSYGSVSMQWLDGKVETFQLHRGSYQLRQVNK